MSASLIKAVHTGARVLGMDDTAYRNYLQDVTGKRTCSGLSIKQLLRVLDAMRRDGFRPMDAEPDPQEKKILALWGAMADAGIVRNRTRKALEQYVRRITGQPLKGCTVKQCQIVIETLKAWGDRVGNAHLQAALTQILASDCPDTAVVQGKVVAGGSYELQ